MQFAEAHFHIFTAEAQWAGGPSMGYRAEIRTRVPTVQQANAKPYDMSYAAPWLSCLSELCIPYSELRCTLSEQRCTLPKSRYRLSELRCAHLGNAAPYLS